MAIPLVALQGTPVQAGNAFLAGRDQAQAYRINEGAAKKAEDEQRMAGLSRLTNAIGYIRQGATPQEQQQRFDGIKKWASANWPDWADEIANIRLDQLEGIAAAVTNPQDAAKLDILRAQFDTEHMRQGYIGEQTASIGRDDARQDWKTQADIADASRRTGIYGAGVANANANRDAMTGLAYDKAARTGYGQVPEGQVLNPQTGRAEDIPGAYRKPLPAAGAPGSGILRPRDYPTAVINAEETDTNEIRTAAQLQDDTSAWLQRLNSGQVNLGGPQNLFNSTLNVLGMGGEETADLQELTAFANRLVNESLRLNKGVQTEGDTIRASNEMLGNLRNPEVVKRQMQVLNDLNERVLSARLQGFKERRARYGLPEFDPSGIIPTRPSPYARGDQGGVPLPPELQGTPDGSSVEGPDGRRYVVQGGQLVPAQ